MVKMLRQHVVSEMTARRFAWTAGFLLLVGCTALVLLALPAFGVAASVGLVSAVALAWGVLGVQFPRTILRPRPGRLSPADS